MQCKISERGRDLPHMSKKARHRSRSNELEGRLSMINRNNGESFFGTPFKPAAARSKGGARLPSDSNPRGFGCVGELSLIISRSHIAATTAGQQSESQHVAGNSAGTSSHGKSNAPGVETSLAKVGGNTLAKGMTEAVVGAEKFTDEMVPDVDCSLP